MAQNFLKRWETPKKDETLGSKLKEAIQPSPPLKTRIEYVSRMIEIQKSKLDQLYNRLVERDRRLFEYLVNYYSKHDINRAKIYANEIAGIRKFAKVVLQCKYALESIILRLETIKDYGDVTSTLIPVANIIKNIKTKIGSVLPATETGLTEINNEISSLLSESGNISAPNISFEAVNEEVEKILSDARIIAEKKIKETFTEIPTYIEKEKESKL